MTKNVLKAVIRGVIPWSAVKGINRALRRLTAFTHQFQFLYEWRLLARPPEWFDHYIDLHWKWRSTRNPSSWERGIFGLLAMRQGCRVLDLCCGTGFFAYYFYSGRAGSVLSMDYNAAAIAQAKRNFKAPNVEYRQGDIRTQLPDAQFDNVTLNAALEYFTPQEADDLLRYIKARLAHNGILSGNSVVANLSRAAHLDQKQEFYSREELATLLKRHFGHVVVFTTTHVDPSMTRTNLYFFASDGALPLTPGWTDVLVLNDMNLSVIKA
jgi:ubiquinone/menaquinone biosynthesis C-methylase UbiE